jgi:ribulose bisphosphate carboxylase small subunit
MKENGALCPDDIMLQLDISNTGCIGVIKYLLGRGFKLTEELMNKAATSGSVQVVKFLRENYCPWSVLTCASAVRHGYLACVRYLLDNGCKCQVEHYLASVD